MSHDVTLFSRSGKPPAASSGELPREFPLKLLVNGSELATLIASPHDLRFLVAGFLYLQGYVRSVEDFEMLSVCEDFGVANVRIKGELPERQAPVLTSGCGTGISFSIPSAPAGSSLTDKPAGKGFPADAVFTLFEDLARQADRYRRHGGIHSAALGDEHGIVLYAEDLGRHNTIDRLAGEALLRGIDIRGKLLATSGRISSEMAAKAAMLGISLIASRTSPTDMALRICQEAGIALIGYVRGDRFTVYAHPERISQPGHGLIEGVTGVILAGGASSRMGRDKGLLEIGGKPFIEVMYATLSGLFPEVIVVTNDPQRYSFLPCRMVPDIHPGNGALAGIHAGLSACSTERAFVTGCDLPLLRPDLIRYLASLPDAVDAVVPRTPDGLQPLHAIYRRECLPVMEKRMQDGDASVMNLLAELTIRTVTSEEIASFDPAFSSFRNINTPEEYDLLIQGSCS